MYQAAEYIDDDEAADTIFAEVLTKDGGGLVRRQIEEAEAFRRNLRHVIRCVAMVAAPKPRNSPMQARLLSAEVVKVNLRRRKQRRVLRLTWYVMWTHGAGLG